MKKQIKCENCGGKRFQCRMSSYKIGGWNKYGTRISSREGFHCSKCGCWIEISYEQKKENKVRKSKLRRGKNGN